MELTAARVSGGYGAGTPPGEVEPYQVGDQVEVWTNGVGWTRAEVLGVRTKSLDVRFLGGHEVPVSKKRARLARG